MTLKGQLFKAYAQEIICKSGFGSNKMIGVPKFWNEYVEKMENDEQLRKEVMDAYIEEKVAEQKAKEEKGWIPFYGGTEKEFREDIRRNYTWASGCRLIERAYKELNESLEWLVTNGYMREWTKRVRLGIAHYYGLTEKGWAVANKYLNA